MENMRDEQYEYVCVCVRVCVWERERAFLSIHLSFVPLQKVLDPIPGIRAMAEYTLDSSHGKHRETEYHTLMPLANLTSPINFISFTSIYHKKFVVVFQVSSQGDKYGIYNVQKEFRKW